MGQTEHAKVTPVQREYDFNPVTVWHQRCIGKLYAQALVLGENGGDAGKIRLAQRDKLEGPAMERGQEFPSPVGMNAIAMPPP